LDPFSGVSNISHFDLGFLDHHQHTQPAKSERHLFGPSFTRLKQGSTVAMSVEIDNIIRTELPYDKEMLSITFIGFANGQGLSLIGLQRGLSHLVSRTVQIGTPPVRYRPEDPEGSAHGDADLLSSG
jgi:hypothetical protein